MVDNCIILLMVEEVVDNRMFLILEIIVSFVLVFWLWLFKIVFLIGVILVDWGVGGLLCVGMLVIIFVNLVFVLIVSVFFILDMIY